MTVPTESPAGDAPPQSASEGVTDRKPGFFRRVGGCFRRGVPKGLKSALWLLAIMVPVTFAVMLLDFSGLLKLIAAVFEPLLGLVGLPGEMAVSIISAVFLNLYTSIAAMGSVPLTDKQVAIIALVVLISHNFPVELVVQKKAGTAAWKMLLLRLGMSVVGAAGLYLLMPDDPTTAAPRASAVATSAAFTDHLGAWAEGSAWLIGKVVVLILALMVLHQFLLEFGIAKILARAFYPLLWLLGLPRSTTVLWIIANTLGLAYGAAVIVEEAESGRLSKEDAQYLNRHVGVCHSLLEDTLLYVAIGVPALWITVPRVVLAAVAVWGYRVAKALAPAPNEGAGGDALPSA